MSLWRWFACWVFGAIAVGVLAGLLFGASGGMDAKAFGERYLAPAIVGAGVGAIVALPIATIGAMIRDIRYRRHH